MENQANSKSLILNYGLYLGILLILAGLIPYAMGMHFEPVAGYLNFAAIALGIILFPILGMNKYKNSNNGFMSWGQGVKIGMGIVLIGTILSLIYQFIFTSFIEPEFYTQLAEVSRNALLDAGMTEEQIEMQLNMQSKFQGTPIGYALSILFMAFIGFVSSAIIAAVKKKSEEETY